MGWGNWWNRWFRREKSKETYVKELNERRPLPMGRTEFEAWSDNIIALAMVTATAESQKFTLANLLLHLGPTESHKEDNFFVHSLRKFAVNQVADTIRCEIRDAAKARLAAEEEAKKLKLVGTPGEVSSPDTADANKTKVLADRQV